MLLYWLCDQGLIGCKEGCVEGECGVCVVFVVWFDGEGVDICWESVNVCFVMLVVFSGQEVVIVEGFGLFVDFYLVQCEFVGCGGLQCGYCIFGFVMSMVVEYYCECIFQNYGVFNGFDLYVLSGNFCCCIGYCLICDVVYVFGMLDGEDFFVQWCMQLVLVFQVIEFVMLQGNFYWFFVLVDVFDLMVQYFGVWLFVGGIDWNVDVNLCYVCVEMVIVVDVLFELCELKWSIGFFDMGMLEIGVGFNFLDIECCFGGWVLLLVQLWL